jgi:hypothetical protein
VDSESDLSSTITVTITRETPTATSEPTTTTALSTSAIPSSEPGTTYYGCYTEGKYTWAVGEDGFYDYSLMTPAACRTYCVDAGYSLWAVEYGIQCFCANSLSPGAVPAPESQCNFACSGDAAQICGANGRLNLYGTSPSRPPVTVPEGAPALLVTTYAYRGCYAEPASGYDDDRALVDSSTTGGDGKTVEDCASFCLFGGSAWFGVENANECYCGSELQAGSAPAPESECNMPCTADASEVCGGTRRLNLYQWV